MKRKVYCIIDSSGSMTELGKSKILKNVLRYLVNTKDNTQETSTEYGIQFYTWSNVVQKLKLEAYSKLPKVEFYGATNMISLIAFYNDIISKEGELTALFLSDGNISRKDINTFSDWLTGREKVKTVSVGIGADQIPFKLEKLSSIGKAYYCDDVSKAINALIFRTNHKVRPLSIEQLHVSVGSK